MSLPGADVKRELRSFWDGSALYWELLASEISLTSPNRELAIRYLPDSGAVLDLGCGVAVNATFFKGGQRYVGVDVSRTALRRPLQPGLNLTCGDVEQLPFPDEKFDAVIATFALEHFVNPARSLAEMCRVVRRGGRIILMGPSWDFPFWHPAALRQRMGSGLTRLRYTLSRAWGQTKAALGAKLPFATIEPPKELRTDYTWDMDAVYLVWTYEVVRFMRGNSCRLYHWEVMNRLLGSRPAFRFVKRLLRLLPVYRYAGSPVLLVFERL